MRKKRGSIVGIIMHECKSGNGMILDNKQDGRHDSQENHNVQDLFHLETTRVCG
jgi:hypothetical protein